MSSYEFCSDCGIDIEVLDNEDLEDFDCSECGDGPLCDRCIDDHKFLHAQGFETVT